MTDLKSSAVVCRSKIKSSTRPRKDSTIRLEDLFGTVTTANNQLQQHRSDPGLGSYSYPNTVPQQSKPSLHSFGLSEASDQRIKPSYSSASVAKNGQRRAHAQHQQQQRYLNDKYMSFIVYSMNTNRVNAWTQIQFDRNQLAAQLSSHHEHSNQTLFPWEAASTTATTAARQVGDVQHRIGAWIVDEGKSIIEPNLLAHIRSCEIYLHRFQAAAALATGEIRHCANRLGGQISQPLSATTTLC